MKKNPDKSTFAKAPADKLRHSGDVVLGMHDALVEFTGMIAGLIFTVANTGLIILTAIIASISASLSMGTANYQAEKELNNPNPIAAGLWCGGAYFITVVLLLLPFAFFTNRYLLITAVMAVAISVIFVFNWYVSRAKGQGVMKPFITMTIIAVTVAAIAFIIGQTAKAFLGVNI